MAVRRTCQDLITAYRAARKARDPDLIQLTSLELGAAMAKRGILIEIGPRPGWATIWQPVAAEGGKPGFAFAPYKLTTAMTAPAFFYPKPKTPNPRPSRRAGYLQLQPT